MLLTRSCPPEPWRLGTAALPVRIALGLSLLAAAAGCEGATAPDPKAHVGTYVLTTVNGNSLPWTFTTTEDFSVAVVAGSMTLDADGTFSDSETFRITQGGSTFDHVETAMGEYEKVGDHISFETRAGRQFTAVLDGNQLTLTDQALLAVYHRP